MNKQAERVLSLLKARGLKDREIKRALANACGISYSSVHDWFSGNTKTIDAANLAAIAKAWNCNLQWLVDGTGESFAMDENVGIAASSDSLNLGGENKEAHQGQGQNNNPLEPIEGAIAIRMQRVPVVGSAQFGDEGYFEELQYPVGHGDGYVEFPSRDPNAYALRGSGNSMSPRFRHGEFIIIEPGTEVQAGDEVMVRLLSGRTMGKIYAYQRDGMSFFDSINQDHPQIAVPTQDIEKMHFIAGVAKRSLFRPTN